MKITHGIVAGIMLIGLPASANAACSYQGVTYAVGSKICSGGWLQECTVAGYWKAIGMCKRESVRDPLAALTAIPGSPKRTVAATTRHADRLASNSAKRALR